MEKRLRLVTWKVTVRVQKDARWGPKQSDRTSKSKAYLRLDTGRRVERRRRREEKEERKNILSLVISGNERVAAPSHFQLLRYKKKEKQEITRSPALSPALIHCEFSIHLRFHHQMVRCEVHHHELET